MNPIPLSWCLGGAAAAMVLGGFAGWTVRDWKRDSEVLEGFKAATKDLEKARLVVDAAATAYEQEKVDAVVQTNTRENTIREYYRDAPAQSIDCAAPGAVVGVLDDSVSAANARAAGQPAPAVSRPAVPPSPLLDPARAVWENAVISLYGDCAGRHRATVEAWPKPKAD